VFNSGDIEEGRKVEPDIVEYKEMQSFFENYPRFSSAWVVL
jgi:hypothetical protein